MEATLELARTENEDKEQIIGRLRNMIRNNQFVQKEKRNQKEKRPKSL